MSQQKNTILFDGPERLNLLPFTYIRPVAELRIGINTLREKMGSFSKEKLFLCYSRLFIQKISHTYF